MQSLEVHAKAPSHRHDDLGQQRCAVGIEQPIERPADAVIAQVCKVRLSHAEERGGKRCRRLLLTVNRRALDDQRAQQNAERLRMRDGRAAVRFAAIEVLLEHFEQAHAFEKVVHER